MPAKRRASWPPAARSTATQARKFFEDNFKPVRILPGVHTYGFYTGADGFFTGYYEAEVAGSRTPTDEYKVPLYSPPKNLIGKKSTVFSKFDRKEIEDGAIAGKGLEICYVKDPVDAFFAQIQGSTRVKLDGRRAAAAQLHRQQRQALYAGRPHPDRAGHLHAGRNVDGQDPRVHGGAIRKRARRCA